MQYLVIFFAIAILFLVRRLNVKNRVKILVLLLLSGIAFGVSFYVMMLWSKVPYEYHQLLCEHFFSKKKIEHNFVLANVTVNMKTAYNLTHDTKYDAYCAYSYYYMYKNNKKSLYKKFDTIESYKHSQYYRNMLEDLPPSFNIDSLHNISGICYNFPSWEAIKPQKFAGNPVPEHQRNASTYGVNLCLCETFVKDDILKAESTGKLFYNQIQSFALSKGINNTAYDVIGQEKGQHRTKAEIFCNRLLWFFSANDISRTNYIFHVQHDGIDSLNLTLRFDEAVDMQEHWVKELDRSPYFVRYAFKFDDNSRSGMIFSVRNIESENLQQMRMFFITTLCLLFFSVFLRMLFLGGKQLLEIMHNRSKKL